MFISSKYTSWFLCAIVVITLIFGSALPQLKFDFDVENLFPRHDKDLRFYQEHIDDFRSDKTYMIIGLEASRGVFNEDFLTRLDAFTREIDSSEVVLSASSITNVRYYLINPFFKTTERPVIHPLEPGAYEEDSLFLVHYPDVKEKFISSLDTAVTVYLELPNNIDSIDGHQFMSQLEAKLRRHGFEQYHFSGGIETDNVYVETLKSELTLLLSLSLLLILVVLFFTFRSFPGVIIPFLLIILTVIWTMGAMALWGVTINVISVLIPSVISIVALSDVIHIMSRYQEEAGKSENWRTAMQLVMKDIGMAILLTSLTTALGFLTLGFADIQPFIEFGVFTALGVIFAWFLAVFLLPVLLVFIHINVSPSYEFGREWPETLYHWVINHKRIITGISLLITAISGIGVSQLKVDSLLYEELSAGDRYSSSLHFFDKHFSGIRPVEIYIETLDDSTVFTPETLARIDSLDHYLTQVYGVRGIYSINTQVKRINRAMHRGLPHHFRLPSNSATLEKILHLVKNQYHSLALKTILTPDYKATVIAAKISDLGSYEIGQRNKALSEFLEQTFPPDQYLFRITGRALLLDKSNEVIAYNLGWGLLIALGAVSVMMGFLFKSLKMALIALFPNLLPLLMVAGVMGLFGVGLKMSTAVIFTIAFGIAVDDTIHFLSRLKTELRKNHSLENALETTYHSTGRAILITSLILVLGFGVLMFSAFTTNFITGFFVSLALLMAVFADLLLLPVMILWVGTSGKS